MKCKDCPRWQGIRYSHWADCHHIIFYMVPELGELVKYNGFKVTPPFDPHDFKYVDGTQVPNFHKIRSIPNGVRLQYEMTKDVWYNDNGEERIRNVKLPHFQTYKNFVCPLES